MGLSEEDRARHPFFQEKRFVEAMQTEGFKKIRQAYDQALEDLVYEELKANFQIRNAQPTISRVIEGTFAVMKIKVEVLNKNMPTLAEAMLKRFGLAKE